MSLNAMSGAHPFASECPSPEMHFGHELLCEYPNEKFAEGARRGMSDAARSMRTGERIACPWDESAQADQQRVEGWLSGWGVAQRGSGCLMTCTSGVILMEALPPSRVRAK